MQNAEEFDCQFSKKVENRNGPANKCGEGQKYLEKRDGGSARPRGIREQR